MRAQVLLRSVLCSLVVVLLGHGSNVVGSQSPQPPADLTVKYSIHETPTDPESPVVWKIELALSSPSVDGKWVGWDVTAVTVICVGQGNEDDTVWTDDDPDPETPDGLWWVEHDDCSQPVSGEFALPPQLAGTASAADSQDPDLDYDIEGATYIPPDLPEQPPYETTAALDYEFTLAGDSEPSGSGSEEPVELPPIEDPPY